MSKLIQPKGSVITEIIKNIISKITSIDTSLISEIKVGLSVNGFTILFDETNGKYFWNINTQGTVTSWSIVNNNLVLVTSSGTYTLSDASLKSSTGASNIGTLNGSTVESELNKKIDLTVLADQTGATKIGTSNGTNVQYELNNRVKISDQQSTSGATNIGTSAGNNVQQELDSKLVASDLSVNSGATKIGTSSGNTVQDALNSKVNSTDLISTTGSSLVGLEMGGTLNNALNYVTPMMFGVYPEKRKTTGAEMTDVTDKLQAMFNYARDNQKIVDMQVACTVGFTTDSLGFYCTKPIDITGVGSIRGKLYIFVDGTTFTQQNGFNWAIINNNANYTGTTMASLSTKGDINHEWVEVRNVQERSGTVSGILWTATRSSVIKLRSFGFSGRGIWLANAYDSTIQRIEVERCGNKDDWAFDASYYTPQTSSDETNGLTISSLLIHNCYNRAWRVYGSKCRVDNVHEEATYSTELPTTPTTQDTRTSLGYINSYFSSVGGGIGSISVQPDTVTSTMNHVCSIGFTGTSAGNIYTTGTFVVMNGDPASSGGSIGAIRCNDLYIIAGARTTISRVEVAGALYGRAIRNDSPIIGGFITNVSENVGNISSVTFRNSVTISPPNSCVYNSCTFNNNFFITGNARSYFNECTFNLDISFVNNSKMEFSRTNFLGNVTIQGTVIDLIFNQGQISGNLSFNSPTGMWLFPNPPRILGTVTGWTWPVTATIIGSITSNPAPANTTGTSITRLYNGSEWIVINKIP